MTKLPGFELIELGLRDLARGELSEAALVVAIGAPRLRLWGVAVPDDVPLEPEIALYRMIRTREGDGAHSAYLAFIRRLESFERALEREATARSR